MPGAPYASYILAHEKQYMTPDDLKDFSLQQSPPKDPARYNELMSHFFCDYLSLSLSQLAPTSCSHGGAYQASLLSPPSLLYIKVTWSNQGIAHGGYGAFQGLPYSVCSPLWVHL